MYNGLTEAWISCNGKAADLVFVIDSSNSVRRTDFHKPLQFVNKIVDHFQIGENDVRVGVVTFSHKLRLDFHLNQYTTKSSLKNAIRNIPFLGGATDTAKAIRYVREEMFKEENGGRSYVSHIVVVITDGYSVNKQATAIEAHIARHKGIIFFAIGIGVPTNNELVMIGNEPTESFVYTVNNFTGLNSIHQQIARTACKYEESGKFQQNDEARDKQNNIGLKKDKQHAESLKSTKQYCGGKPADVYVVLDSSSSIWEPDFLKELNFTKQLVDIFDISPDHTRVGVIEYSDGVHPVIPLNNSYDKETLKTRIGELQRLTGGTNTGSVIKYITQHAFDKKVARPNVAHVTVILTDGQSKDPRVTAAEAAKARAKGIYVFAIGIGKSADNTELNAIASDPDDDYVFQVESFQALNTIVDILAMKTCEAEGGFKIQSDTQPISGEKMDIMFLFDSYSFGQRKSGVIRQSIGTMIQNNKFNIGDNSNISIGVMSKVCQKEKNIKLSPYRLTSELLYESKSDGVDKLLRKVRHHGFDSRHGGRKNAKKMVILFLGEELNNPTRVVLQAKRTAFKVELFVINIGNKLSKNMLRSVCSKPYDSHLISVPDYEDIPVALQKVMHRLHVNT